MRVLYVPCPEPQPSRRGFLCLSSPLVPANGLREQFGWSRYCVMLMHLAGGLSACYLAYIACDLSGEGATYAASFWTSSCLFRVIIFLSHSSARKPVGSGHCYCALTKGAKRKISFLIWKSRAFGTAST